MPFFIHIIDVLSVQRWFGAIRFHARERRIYSNASNDYCATMQSCQRRKPSFKKANLASTTRTPHAIEIC